MFGLLKKLIPGQPARKSEASRLPAEEWASLDLDPELGRFGAPDVRLAGDDRAAPPDAGSAPVDDAPAASEPQQPASQSTSAPDGVEVMGAGFELIEASAQEDDGPGVIPASASVEPTEAGACAPHVEVEPAAIEASLAGTKPRRKSPKKAQPATSRRRGVSLTGAWVLPDMPGAPSCMADDRVEELELADVTA